MSFENMNVALADDTPQPQKEHQLFASPWSFKVVVARSCSRVGCEHQLPLRRLESTSTSEARIKTRQ